METKTNRQVTFFNDVAPEKDLKKRALSIHYCFLFLNAVLIRKEVIQVRHVMIGDFKLAFI